MGWVNTRQPYKWWDDEFHKNWVMESKDGDELRVSLKRLRINDP